MKKAKNLFVAFAIVGFLVSISITEAQAGASPPDPPTCSSTPVNDCVDCCKDGCYAGQYKGKLDCSGAMGEDMKDCRFLNNIFAQCCQFFCLEDQCGIDAGDAIVCEALEEICGIYQD